MIKNADWIVYPSIAALVLATDQSLKKAVKKKIPRGKRVNVKDKVVLSNERNRGAAFNSFEKSPKFVRYASTMAAGCVCGLLTATLSMTAPGEQKLKKTGLAILAGGALGNVTDRIRDGYVTDYVSLAKGPEKVRQIVFNAADVAVATGSIMALAADAGKEDD